MKVNTEELALFFKMFSDETRLKIIEALVIKEFSVNELAEEVNMSQTAVSYQLRILRDSHIVKYRKDAQNVFYSIDDEHISYLITLLVFCIFLFFHGGYIEDGELKREIQ